MSKTQSKDKNGSGNSPNLSVKSDVDLAGVNDINISDNQNELEDIPLEPRFQPVINNLAKVDHDFLKNFLDKENDEFANKLLEQIERMITNETIKIQRANLKNKELKKNIKNCELELKVQRKMQDSDFKELQEISKHREEINKFENEKGTLDKNINDTKKKINDLNVDIQTLLGKIEANSIFFAELPEESRNMLIKEIQDNKILNDFIKTKSFLRKYLV